jgi:hypothetical protein
MSALMSEAMRKRWADPEWKARQRKAISKGLLASPHVEEAARKAAKTRAMKRIARTQSQSETPPWKPGDPKPEWLRRAG